MKATLFVYGAGSLAALLACSVILLIQILGLSQLIQLPSFPVLSQSWLYPKVIWGGLLSLCFVLPFMSSNTLVKSAVLALVISLVELFFALPFNLYHGVMGLNVGMVTFLIMLGFNLVWAMLTSLILTIAK